MPTLQQALAAIRVKPASQPVKPPRKASSKPTTASKAPRRVEMGTFNDKVQIAVYGKDDRPNPSKPPKKHEAAYAERYFPEVFTYYLAEPAKEQA